MAVNTDTGAVTLNPNRDISPRDARSYIIDMLAELCTVAEQSQQEDMLVLLKLVIQAARSARTD